MGPIVLTARMSKDGKRVLCGNRQCRHAGLAHIEGTGRNKYLHLMKGLDQRRDGIYAVTKRVFERTNAAFKLRESLRTDGADITGNSGVMSASELRAMESPEFEKEYQQFQSIPRENRYYIKTQALREQMLIRIPAYALDKRITVRCPRCHNCSRITRQVIEGGCLSKT